MAELASNPSQPTSFWARHPFWPKANHFDFPDVKTPLSRCTPGHSPTASYLLTAAATPEATSTKRLVHFTAFHWVEGASGIHTVTRQDLVNALDKILTRLRTVTYLLMDMSHVLADAWDDKSIVHLRKRGNDVCVRESKLVTERAMLAKAYNKELQLLEAFEQRGLVPKQWRRYPGGVSFESFKTVPDVDRELADKKDYPVSWVKFVHPPNSIQLDKGNGEEAVVSDWVLGVAKFLDEHDWKDWNDDGERSAEAVIDEARAILNHVEILVPAQSLLRGGHRFRQQAS